MPLRRLLRPALHLLLYALLMSCITPYQPENRSLGTLALVVDGYITDQPGPHQVRLSRTADFNTSTLQLVEEGASVYVEDDGGGKQAFSYITQGIYRTPATFRGEAGRTYTLHITLANGLSYQSKPELLRASPPIDRVYDEYTERAIEGTGLVEKGFNVSIDTKDAATPGDYYRWNWVHFEPVRYCGIRSVTTGTTTVRYGYGCCQKCWDIVRCSGVNCLNATSDELINGRAISGQFIMRAPFASNTGYYLEIEQLSISRAAYAYYQLLENLTKNNGGIFDAAPATLRGNIVPLNDPAERVFGFFSAAGAQRIPYVVDRSRGQGIPNSPVLPQSPPEPLPDCAPCEEGDFRTRIQPRWWPF